MNYIADLHVHSCASPDGWHTPRELAATARSRGLDAIALCDHDISAVPPLSGEVLLIPATEITTACGHLLGLFLEQPCDHAALGKYPSLTEAVAEIHRCGGLAVLAHPFAPQKAEAATLATFPVDGIEIANARAALYRHSNEQAADLAAVTGKFTVGGSDAHHRRELKGAVTHIEAPELTVAALRKAVAEGHCRGEALTPTKWRYKGLSMLKKHFTRGSLRQKIKACIYFALCLLRDLIHYRR